MENTHSILVIEDEPKVAQLLQQGLTEAGFLVSVANNGEDGLICIMEQVPDALVLDLNLPGRDGIEVLTTLRKQHPHLPVLILSARDTVDDRVLGLESGADDYLIKPFAFPELISRLRVMLRRDQSRSTLEYQAADLQLDVIKRQATRQQKKLNLTPREFEILELLLRNKGRPVSRHTIARDVWQVERATPLDNVIDVHVMRLRKKIDDDFEPKLLHTIRGLGYVITDNPEDLD